MDEKWIKRFILMAGHVAEWSKDPRTKCGAVIVRPDKTIASIGFNGFPRGMPDKDDHYADHATKHSRVIHAEINAILSANEPVRGFSIFTWPIMPCDRCATHIIQAGITHVYTPWIWKGLPNVANKLRPYHHLAKQYFDEACIEVGLIDHE